MTRYTKLNFALAACDLLLDGKTRNTNAILNALSIDHAHRQICLKRLKRLADRGVLNRRGTGKFLWTLANPNYNRTNPYATPTTPTDTTTPDVRPDGSFVAKYHSVCKRCGKAINPGDTLVAHKDEFGKKSFIHAYCKPADVREPIRDEDEDRPTQPTNDTHAKLIGDLVGRVMELTDRLAAVESTRKVEIKLIQPDKKDRVITDRVHPVFEQVMFHLNCKDNVMLVGPKGCGKTMLAGQIAKELELDYGMLSLSGGVTESKLFGRVTPNITTGESEFHPAPFITLFESGGLFLLDEVDAADPNVLLSLNSALDNGKVAVDRGADAVVKRDPDFVCLAAANTWGNGADRQYVGRNQQDSAFTERFVQIAMDYDHDLEFALCPGADELVARMHDYRRRVVANRLERTISTRFICRAFNWLKHGKNLDYVESMLFAGWTENEVRKTRGN